MNSNNITKIEFLSKSCNEGYSRVAVASFVSQLDPTLAELNEIKTAVSEAVTNAIVHGYRDTIGKIYITVKTTNDRITVTVRDRGCGIENIEEARQPLFTTGNRNERSGMGFTIMESFMDKITIKSTPGKGTKITMAKTLNIKE